MENRLIVTLYVDELKRIIEECVTTALAKIPTPKKEDDTLLTRKDVAKLFSISLVTVNEWKRVGRIPYYRMNRRIYFKKEELLKAIEINPKYKKFF